MPLYRSRSFSRENELSTKSDISHVNCGDSPRKLKRICGFLDGVRYETHLVTYDYGELDEVSLAYAISIHKSQDSEFPVVVIPLAIQQYMLLERNLVYTGITRGKRLVMLAGEAKALRVAIRKNNTHARHSGLLGRFRLQQFKASARL